MRNDPGACPGQSYKVVAIPFPCRRIVRVLMMIPLVRGRVLHLQYQAQAAQPETRDGPRVMENPRKLCGVGPLEGPGSAHPLKLGHRAAPQSYLLLVHVRIHGFSESQSTSPGRRRMGFRSTRTASLIHRSLRTLGSTHLLAPDCQFAMAPSRRRHQKSRYGCLECKRRRVKASSRCSAMSLAILSPFVLSLT